MNIYNEYFQLSSTYQKTYGENTILLMQVGAFFEMYGIKDTENTKIVDICGYCNLNISDKKNTSSIQEQYVMAGFRDYQIEKYLQKITEYGYTVVVYVQKKEGKTITRELQAIYSPGTYISYDEITTQPTNNIMCIWLDTHHTTKFSLFVCGFSVINIFTGKSYIYEYETTFSLNPTTFDELERGITVYSPSEIILISPFDKPTIQTIIQYSKIQAPIVHMVDLTESSFKEEKARKCQKQNYILHSIATYFGKNAYYSNEEFTTYPTATQSLCYLLDFLQEHNPNLISKMDIPIFTNTSDRMILANHTLKQLNIISSDSVNNIKKQFQSITSLINQCVSPIGSRMFHGQITNPVFDEGFLLQEYEMIECWLSPNTFPMIEPLRKKMVKIKDLEKIGRQIVLNKLYPSTLYSLVESIEIIQQLNVCLYENQSILHYLGGQEIEMIGRKIIDFIGSRIIIEKCKGVQSVLLFEENIIQTGISPKLDTVLHQYNEQIGLFHEIRIFLNSLLGEAMEYVKIHETEKGGYSLVITKTRAKLLKENIAKRTTCIVPDTLTIFKKYVPDINELWKEIKITTSTNSMDEITFSLLGKTTKRIQSLKEETNLLISNAYNTFIRELEMVLPDIQLLTIFVGKLDVITTKAFVAYKYNYCCPTIVANSRKSFFEAENLRHPLIEHLNMNEVYVSNNVSLGNEEIDGILLFGTNAVGKTSLIRAIGICIIMAQCGCYVPCSSFKYKPYKSIYSRILGNDNLFKNMSTFMVEMSELRTILKMADSSSLILGDELASGTETESALSIFTSGLIDLHEKEASFIFATHMHEIIKFEEIQNLKKLVSRHLEVYYDREKDCLIYNRTLKEGSGNSMYGLEVCKYLKMPVEFLDKAMEIRTKYFPEKSGQLSFPVSSYHRGKIRGICEMCKKEISSETHHIVPQKKADKRGFMANGTHKNHPANLMAVCEKCHQTIHHLEK
jgi:DNA mismatch repair protein MutS